MASGELESDTCTDALRGSWEQGDFAGERGRRGYGLELGEEYG